MIIKELEHMESIVKKNKSLSWNGWDVVHTFHSDKARTSAMGVFKDNTWKMQKIYSPMRQGWDIPNKFVE